MEPELVVKEHPVEQIQNLQQINRPIGLSLGGYDPNSGRIQVNIELLSSLLLLVCPLVCKHLRQVLVHGNKREKTVSSQYVFLFEL